MFYIDVLQPVYVIIYVWYVIISVWYVMVSVLGPARDGVQSRRLHCRDLTSHCQTRRFGETVASRSIEFTKIVF